MLGAKRVLVDHPRDTAQAHAVAGTIPIAARNGNRCRYAREDLDAYLSKRDMSI